MAGKSLGIVTTLGIIQQLASKVSYAAGGKIKKLNNKNKTFKTCLAAQHAPRCIVINNLVSYMCTQGVTAYVAECRLQYSLHPVAHCTPPAFGGEFPKEVTSAYCLSLTGTRRMAKPPPEARRRVRGAEVTVIWRVSMSVA